MQVAYLLSLPDFFLHCSAEGFIIYSEILFHFAVSQPDLHLNKFIKNVIKLTVLNLVQCYILFIAEQKEKTSATKPKTNPPANND